MTAKYHAGTSYTPEQREQLDAAYQNWLDLDLVDTNYGYDDETAHSKATAAYKAYEALEDEFAAANATRRVVAAGNKDGLFFVADELMEAEVNRWYNAALVGLRPLASSLIVSRLRREYAAMTICADDYDGRELVDQEPTKEGWL